MSELPDDAEALPCGWAWSTIGELALEVRNGLSPKPNADCGLPVLRISAVRALNVDVADRRYFDPPPPQWERAVLKAGDLLFTRYSGTPAFVGVCGVVPEVREDLVYPDKLIRVRIDDRIALPGFVEKSAACGVSRAAIESNLKTTSGQVGLAGGDLKETPLPLPPLNEQRRIVDKIEALTARSRRAKEALDAVPALLDKLRQSILAAAFRGDLTADWRAAHPDVEPASVLLERIRKERRDRWEQAELAKMQAKGKPPKNDTWKSKYKEPEPVDTEGLPELPEGWAWASVEQLLVSQADVFDGPFGSALKTSDYCEAGVRVIRLENVAQLRFVDAKKTYISEQKYQTLLRHTVREGDIIFGSFVDETTRVCVLPPLAGPAVAKADCFCVRPWPGIVSVEFLAAALGSPQTHARLTKSIHGATRPRVNTGQVRAAVVPLPPLAEQAQLVRRLQESILQLEALQGAREGIELLLDTLDSSTLAKAFRGELVPQDPNDEPASVLLERIRAEREAAGSAKKTKKQPAARKRATRKSKAAAT